MILISKADFKNNIVDHNTSIEDGIRLLQSLKNQIIFVTKNNKLYASITDNDLREHYLKLKSGNKNQKFNVSDIANKKTFFILKSNLKKYDKKKLEIKIKKFKFIPILNNQKAIIEILGSNNKLNNLNSSIKTNAILMAGGFGTRLKPITNTVPKPIILINKSSNLISLMNVLKESQINNFFITTHYLSKLIRKEVAMFWHEKDKVTFFNEKKLLGTFGSVIAIIKKYKLKNPIIICNSDIVTNLKFSNVIEYFYKNKCKFLICNKILKSQTSYGVIIPKRNNKLVSSFQEKPLDYKLINAGIYMIDPKTLLKFFPRTKKLSVVDVIEKLLKNKIKCHIFPIKEFWSDMGTHEELEKVRNTGKV